MTLDTNVIIYYIHRDPIVVSVVDDLFRNKSVITLSVVSALELFSFPGLEAKEAEVIDKILSTLRVISLEMPIARLAGTIRRLYNLHLPDAVIAATALLNDKTLVTRNFRDFRKIPDLEIQKI